MTNEVSATVRNLAGDVTQTWGQSGATGSCVALSSFETTYSNSFADDPGDRHDLDIGNVNIGKKIVETAMQAGNTSASQATHFHPDGRTFQTFGGSNGKDGLRPSVRYGYAATPDGLLTAAGYIDGPGVKEIAATQADYAGRTKAAGRLSTMDFSGQGSTTLLDATNNTYFDSDTSVPAGSRGRLKSTEDADGVRTLFAYNSLGERTTTALKLDNGDTITYGTDQVARTTTFPSTRGSIPVLRTETRVWFTDDTQNPATVVSPVVSYTEHTPGGLESWSWQAGRGESHTVSGLGADRTETTTRPDGSYTTTTHEDGLPVTVARHALGGGDAVSSTTYSRDSLHHVISSTDQRTGTTWFTDLYDHDENPETPMVRSPHALVTAGGSPRYVEDPAGNVTRYTYDHQGRRTSVDAPDTAKGGGGTLENKTFTEYNPQGRVQRVYGDQVYPVSYTYDYSGRMKSMTTGGSAGMAVTAWNYCPITGLLLSKRHASNEDGDTGSGPDYDYTPGGRLWHRWWARHLDPNDTESARVTTSYGYDTAGRLTTIDYNDNTPDIEYTRDALARIKTVERGGNTHATYQYDPNTLHLKTETLNQDTLARTLHRHHDSFGRPLSLELKSSSATDYTTAYGHDTAGRLDRVWHLPALDATSHLPSGDPTFTYGYNYEETTGGLHQGTANADNPSMLPFRVTGPGHIVERTYEPNRDALLTIKNSVGGATVSSYSYEVNEIGQRTGLTTAFNLGGNLSSNPGDTGWGYDSLGQLTSADAPDGATFTDRTYSYDSIGNRSESKTGDYVTQDGQTTFTADTVTNYYGDLGNLPTPGANPLNQYARITAGTATMEPVHDADGNMTSGPVPAGSVGFEGVPAPTLAGLTWDAENRLTSVTYGTTTIITITYDYDYLGRMIRRSVGTSTTHYHYDGWNRIAEYTGSTPALTRSYTWGLDLSGTLQGAGGVGGLLALKIGTNHYCPTYDGNGNISEYLYLNSGAVSAHFEYDPFGNLTKLTGSTVQFTYRFSTKPRDLHTGLYYYGFRYYDPLTGRWPSRDPSGERGGANLYGFVRNSSVNAWDRLGLDAWISGGGDHTGIMVEFKNAKGEVCGCLSADFHARGYMGDGGNGGSSGSCGGSSGSCGSNGGLSGVLNGPGRVGLTFIPGKCKGGVRTIKTTAEQDDRLIDFIVKTSGSDRKFFEQLCCEGKTWASNRDGKNGFERYRVLTQNCDDYVDAALDELLGYNWCRELITDGDDLLQQWDERFDQDGNARVK